MLTNPRTQQSGFGLVELMIGLVVGMIVVAAALSLLTSTMSVSNDSIKMTRLDQELRQTMTMLTRDLRRATIWDPAADVVRVAASSPLTLSAVNGNVTVTSVTGNLEDLGAKAVGAQLVYKRGSTVYRATITAYNSANKSYSVTIATAWPAGVTAVNGVPAGSWSMLRPESILTFSGTCILFASDTDLTGTYGTGERLGYRYDDAEDAVEVRTSGLGTDNCAQGTWENLTDERSVEIYDFNVDDNSPAPLASSGFNLAIREFTIRIKGRLKSDPSVERTLQETVRVRNDRLI